MKAQTTDDRMTEVMHLRQQLAAQQTLLHKIEAAREAARKSDLKCRTVFENAGTATFVTQSDMTISTVNHRFEILTGYSKLEIEGRLKWTHVFAREDHGRLARCLAERRGAEGPPKELACRIVGRNGQVRDVIFSLDIVPGTREIVGSLMDISALKKAKRYVLESKAQLSAIVEAFDGLIYACTADYRILYVNAKMSRQSGYDTGQKLCYRAIHGRRTPCSFCPMTKVQKGQVVRFDITNPGNGRWYASTNTPIYHTDKNISLLAMITDIHERKLAEIALKESAQRLHRENRALKSGLRERFRFGDIIGKSPVMQEVYEQILRAAGTDTNVIIYGEPGTGKELVARAIHDTSQRRARRFVPVHCGAIPETLFESEFFGYKKGAFSGAYHDKPGYLNYAHQGTLFLDEIGEINPHMQMKLLRAIEGDGYTPVGSTQVKTSDFRIVAATNRDLKELVRQGLVRQDFFYRIHIIPIHLPPLRERKEDIPLLADYFLKKYSRNGCPPSPLDGKFYEILHGYNWPGNVRELQNAIIRFCATGNLNFIISSGKRMDVCHLVASPTLPIADHTLKEHIQKLEKNVIAQALQQHHWHRSKTSAMLGIDRKTLAAKIKRYRLMTHSS